MKQYKKWIYLAIFLLLFYYIFIVNLFITVPIIVSLYIALKLYKMYGRRKLNKLSASKELFRESELGHFIALVAKVAKADGRVDELEAQLIGMMFDDISKVFKEKKVVRSYLREIFNEEKQRGDDTKAIAQSLNKLIGRSRLRKKQYVEFLIQLAFIDNGISASENRVLQEIITQMEVSVYEYEAMVAKFDQMMKNKQQTMTLKEAYKILGVSEEDDFVTIKKAYRNLVRKYHPDIIESKNKDEAYIEEATAKTQEINQAYQVIKDSRKS